LISVIMDLFFEFKWNSILHQTVFSILTLLLQSPNEMAVHHVIEDCHLLDRILAAEAENEEYLRKTNISYGVVSFLTRLSLLIDGLVQHHPFVHDILVSRVDWQKYVTDILAPRNNHESRLLGGGLRYPAESTDDDDVGDLNGGGGFEDWFFERDDDNEEETLELIQSDVIYDEDDDDDDDDESGGGGVGQDGIGFIDSYGSGSDSDDDETIVQRDLPLDDSDNEDPFPSASDSSLKE